MPKRHSVLMHYRTRQPTRWRGLKVFCSTLLGIIGLGTLVLTPAAFANTHVVAVGDVALCQQHFSQSMAAKTAQLVPEDATVLLLGDTTYPALDAEHFDNCFNPTWGKFLARTYAVAGNHDIVDHSDAFFLKTFNRPVGRKAYFRAPLGEDAWVIGLDSNLKDEALAQQLQWLEHELKNLHDERCLIAMWHHATLSTGLHRGDGDALKPAWNLLNAARADLILSGHEHFYESFDPKDANGQPVSDGIREFVVGTGGALLVDVGIAQGQRRLLREFGLLGLSFHDHQIDWAFHSVTGKTYDEGHSECRRYRH